MPKQTTWNVLDTELRLLFQKLIHFFADTADLELNAESNDQDKHND